MKTYKDIAGDGGSNILEQVTAQQGRVKSRMASVRHIVAVMSGKGGVGKSSVVVNLASALALQDYSIGILDADINGASIARMTGVRGQPLSTGETGVMPPAATRNLKVMSIDLFLPDDSTPVLWDAPTQKDAYTWRGMMEIAAIREFLSDTEWGELDFLFIDLPPGTDKLPNMVDLLPRISGTIIVTIPSQLSQFVVGKSISMAKDLLRTPVIGLVENMSTYVCRQCGHEEKLFPGELVEELASRYDVPYLGRIPFDPRVAACADEGSLFLEKYSGLPATTAIEQIAQRVGDFCEIVESG
jgi:ATP-binding protein involved in chromosome partitioning